MRTTVVTLTALLFFIWLLPLGIFIKPSQEKFACDGQRAICLCSHMKVSKAMESSVGLNLRASASKEGSSPGGASHYFSVLLIKTGEGLQLSSLFEQQYLCYKDPFLTSLDHVPKV